LVFLRGGGGGSFALVIRSLSFSRTSSRFRSWERNRAEKRTTTPSLVSFEPKTRPALALIRSLSEGELRRSKRSSTAVATLLTFWPPGPEARTKDPSAPSRQSRSCHRYRAGRRPRLAPKKQSLRLSVRINIKESPESGLSEDTAMRAALSGRAVDPGRQSRLR
jgi:hypothetical protein